MAFDPVTLLTMSVVVLVALGALMLHIARDEQGCRLLRWSGTAFLCLGVGFVMLLAAPADVHAPVRVLGNAALMLPYGLLWAAARQFSGRRAPFEAVTAGALCWLIAATLFDPSQGVRVALTSAIVVAYSLAAAYEHRRGAGALQSQRFAAWILAAHGGFFALRAVLGPTFGLAPWGPDVAQFWGALLGLETVTLGVTVAVASIGMSRERIAKAHRREALEDPLTGIGNRRALQRSGAALLAACRGAGRPASLLLMDLDGFKRVNDRHGHPAGDRLLVAFARLAHEYLPPTSLVCRIGGEEFA
ncbi:MAG: diguanylate cyclase, partial [Caulobacteraceae bacterium]|nr:diguanylate cyclase [Caulobacter sp.]